MTLLIIAVTSYSRTDVFAARMFVSAVGTYIILSIFHNLGGKRRHILNKTLNLTDLKLVQVILTKELLMFLLQH